MHAEVGLKEKVYQVVIDATEGEFSIADLERVKGNLEELGISSLAFLQFVELLEQRFGVIVDPETDPEKLMTVTSVMSFIEDCAREARTV